MKEEGIDSIFKKGLTNRNIPFDMEAWRRMEQMLPPETKASTFSFGYAAAAVGLLLVVAGSLFMFSDQDTEVFADQMTVSDREMYNSGYTVTKGSSATLKPENESEITEIGNEKLGSQLTDNSLDSKGQAVPAKKESLSESNTNSTNTVNSNKKSKVKSANSFFVKASNSSNGFFDQIERPNSDDIQRDEAYSEEKLAISSNSLSAINEQNQRGAKFSTSNISNTLIAQSISGNRPKAERNVLGFIGGVNVNNSLVESSSSAVTLSEFFGVQYERYLNGGLSLRSNLLYSARSNVNTHKIYEEKIYDFGSRTEQLEVNCNRLIYLELPVLLNYGLANHNFMAGPSFSYLLNGWNSLTTHYNSDKNSTTVESTSWGYIEGFKSYDVALVAGYEYTFKPKLAVGARVNYGFIDLTDDTYFNEKSFDNNVQIRVYVTYSPFQF